MRFVIDRAAFAAAVGKVSRFAAAESPQRHSPAWRAGPILRGILVTATGDGVEVLATDMDDTGRVTVTATVGREGRALVDAATLARIARHLPGGDAHVWLDRHWLTVASGGVRYRLLTMPASDYPGEVPPGRPLDGLRPAAPGQWEHRLDHGDRSLRDFRRRWRPSRTAEPYRPTGLQPGSWITWKRQVDGETVEVRGQVWSAAPGSRTVWAVVEGERAAVRVQERTYGRAVERYQLAEVTS